MSGVFNKVGKLVSAAMILLVVMLTIVMTGVWLFIRELPFFR